jgi:hypothetical protein
MRPANASMKSGVRMRMKPASTTSCGWCSDSSRTNAWSYIGRSGKSPGARTRVGMFIAAAISKPSAAARSLMTVRISIGRLPAAARSAMTRMFVPRPEIRIAVGSSVIRG